MAVLNLSGQICFISEFKERKVYLWIGERGQYLWDGGESICLINEPLVPRESVCTSMLVEHSEAGKCATMEPISSRLANIPYSTPVPGADAKTGQICIFGSHPQGGGS